MQLRLTLDAPEASQQPEADPATQGDCPTCAGSGSFLGALGTRGHYRCRCCGMEWSSAVVAPANGDVDFTL